MSLLLVPMCANQITQTSCCFPSTEAHCLGSEVFNSSPAKVSWFDLKDWKQQEGPCLIIGSAECLPHTSCFSPPVISPGFCLSSRTISRKSTVPSHLCTHRWPEASACSTICKTGPEKVTKTQNSSKRYIFIKEQSSLSDLLTFNDQEGCCRLMFWPTVESWWYNVAASFLRLLTNVITGDFIQRKFFLSWIHLHIYLYIYFKKMLHIATALFFSIKCITDCYLFTQQ